MDHVQITFHPMTSELGGASPVLSSVFDVAGFAKLVVFLNIEDISAGANITAQIQDSMDGQNWNDLGGLSSGTIGVTKSTLSDPGRFVRAKYTYAGTDPNVAFSLIALAREF